MKKLKKILALIVMISCVCANFAYVAERTTSVSPRMIPYTVFDKDGNVTETGFFSNDARYSTKVTLNAGSWVVAPSDGIWASSDTTMHIIYSINRAARHEYKFLCDSVPVDLETYTGTRTSKNSWISTGTEGFYSVQLKNLSSDPITVSITMEW